MVPKDKKRLSHFLSPASKGPITHHHHTPAKILVDACEESNPERMFNPTSGHGWILFGAVATCQHRLNPILPLSGVQLMQGMLTRQLWRPLPQIASVSRDEQCYRNSVITSCRPSLLQDTAILRSKGEVSKAGEEMRYLAFSLSLDLSCHSGEKRKMMSPGKTLS